MNLLRSLFLLACVLFVLFLASPTLVDSIDGRGQVTMQPGFAVMLWHLACFPTIFGNYSDDWLALGSLLIVHLAAVSFPVLYLTRAFCCRWLSLLYGSLLLLGVFPVVWLIHISGHAGLGAYAWIASLLCAAICCLTLFRTTPII